DLFHGHVGGIDALARALLVAAEMVEEETLSKPKADRYAGWSSTLGGEILTGSESLASLADKVMAGDIDPKPTSGRQEWLENRVNEVIWSTEA
ncbi:MAG: xylose isomerase, partial [Acidimicrobiia bacterium]